MFAPAPNRLSFPWWRSRGFWFGLIGMIFLLLSWRGSFRWDSGFSYANRYWQGLRLQQRYGEVGVTWIDPCMGSGFQAWQAPLRLPREEEKEMEFLIWGMPEHHVHVRYPVLIASYVGIWLGTLLWWQRRKRRMVLEIQ